MNAVADEAAPAAAANADARSAAGQEKGGGSSMLRVVVEGCCHGELDQVSRSVSVTDTAHAQT